MRQPLSEQIHFVTPVVHAGRTAAGVGGQHKHGQQCSRAYTSPLRQLHQACRQQPAECHRRQVGCPLDHQQPGEDVGQLEDRQQRQQVHRRDKGFRETPPVEPDGQAGKARQGKPTRHHRRFQRTAIRLVVAEKDQIHRPEQQDQIAIEQGDRGPELLGPGDRDLLRNRKQPTQGMDAHRQV